MNRLIAVNGNILRQLVPSLLSNRLLSRNFIASFAVLMAMSSSVHALSVEEATIADVQAAFLSGQMTARQLVTEYLKRVDAYDQQGPYINSLSI